MNMPSQPHPTAPHAVGRFLVALLLLSSLPAAARAQVAWDTPRMIGPESPTGFGVYFLRSEALGPQMDAAMATLGLPGYGGRHLPSGWCRREPG